MLSVLIADDHEIVRHGVRLLIENQLGWEVCGEASNGNEVLEMAQRAPPDVAVLDVSLPGLNGITVTRQLKQALPKTAVLLFTMHDDDETISNGLAAGARGYLHKTDGGGHLVEAIAALAAHRSFLPPRLSELLGELATNKRQLSHLAGFTVRELEVAQLIAEGESNKSIARKLGISAKTVESHRASAMRKADVRSAAGLVRFAIRHNLLAA